MNTLSIKAKVIITAVVIVVINSIFTYTGEISELRETLNNSLKKSCNLFPLQLNSEAEGLAKVHEGFTKMDELLRLFSERNKAELLDYVKPMFEALKAKYRITHMYFIEPNGKIFLRAHMPEQSGDIITRATYRHSAETNKISSGVEMGKNFFSLRSVHPISYKGTAIGYLEFGEEIYRILANIKEITGDDAAILLTKKFVASKSIDLKRDNTGDFIVLESTDKDTAIKIANKSGVDITKGLETFICFYAGSGNKNFALGVCPLKDAFGETAGVLLFYRDISKQYRAIWKTILINVASFAAILMIAYLIALKKSLRLLNDVKRNISEITRTWNLNRELKVQRKDEIGELAAGVNAFIYKLRDVIYELKSAVDNINSISVKLHETSEKLSVESAEQTEKTTTIALSTKVMSQNTLDISQNTGNIAQAMTDTINIAKIGRDAVNKTIDNVQQIEENVSVLAQIMQSLGSRSAQIGEIVSVINDIADQTNLLALNASIEAARAGEHGRGFAIVADSVRKLAEKTSSSTKEITEMISSIQTETTSAIFSMQQSTGSVHSGVDLSRKSGDVLDSVVNNLNDLHKLINKIAKSTSEISTVSHNITQSTTAVAASSVETTECSAMVLQASTEFVEFSQNLRTMLGQFKVDNIKELER
ncbi:methyl-accepting chemotaxis protein [Candidatus Magnetomonas plexicatena]|uniref:methyl-accepting chemotaxis protein n=1 Tax=Candidatus Magnetomonas plexicatena TaxID=2552947 RepID=UPI001C773DFD|nr:methyl-accepting chemotaxis protein [Nitrospirales bacterium LBB_01]